MILHAFTYINNNDLPTNTNPRKDWFRGNKYDEAKKNPEIEQKPKRRTRKNQTVCESKV